MNGSTRVRVFKGWWMFVSCTVLCGSVLLVSSSPPAEASYQQIATTDVANKTAASTGVAVPSRACA